jgi:hypothetical protein
VRQVLDPNPFPPGVNQSSIVVKTRDREMKFTAESKDRHDMWFAVSQFAIDFILAVTQTSYILAGHQLPSRST